MLIEMNGVAELAGSSHLDLVENIKDRDPGHAEMAVREHIDQATRNIIDAADKLISTRRSFADAAGIAQSKDRGEKVQVVPGGTPCNLYTRRHPRNRFAGLLSAHIQDDPTGG